MANTSKLSLLFSSCRLSTRMRRYTATTEASKQTVMRMPPGFARVPAFNIFFKENFVKKEGMSITTVMKDLREKWRQMSEEERKKYADQSDRIMMENKSKFESLKDEEKQRLIDENNEAIKKRREKKRRKEKLRQWKLSEHPVKPPSAYNLYVKERMEYYAKKPTSSASEMFKKIAAEWKNLSEPEKEKFIARAAPALRRYTDDVQKWKENMKNRGGVPLK